MTVLDDAGEPQYLIKTHEDVTDRRQTESRMAHYGLSRRPDRSAEPRRVPAGAGADDLRPARAPMKNFAVLSVDLDGLKEVNDVFGHAIGDKLLIEVARLLQSLARGGSWPGCQATSSD
jgi:predicted signal transduction protein with EAL and GGDEF domain